VQRVLIVNHDEELMLLLKLEIGELRRNVGVDLACSLPAALELARSRHPDLVILGVDNWPEGSRRVLRSLRQLLGTNARFILVGYPAALQQHHDQPVVAFLSRPVQLAPFRAAFGKATLQEAVREDVRGPGELPAAFTDPDQPVRG